MADFCNADKQSQIMTKFIEDVINGLLPDNHQERLDCGAPGMRELIAREPERFRASAAEASALLHTQEQRYNVNVAEMLGLNPLLNIAISGLNFVYKTCECGKFVGIYPDKDHDEGIKILIASDFAFQPVVFTVVGALANACTCVADTHGATNADKWKQLLKLLLKQLIQKPFQKPEK